MDEKETPEPKTKSSAQERLDSIKGHKTSAIGQEVVKRLRGLYDSGAKLWTKDMFADFEAQLAQDPMPDAIMIRSMTGTPRRKKIPKRRDGLEGDEWVCIGLGAHFRSIDTIIFEAEQDSLECDSGDDASREDVDDRTTLSGRGLTLSWNYQPKIKAQPVTYDMMKTAWDEAKENWDQSTVSSSLHEILGQCARLPRTITKIVCFGLGNMDRSALDASTDNVAASDGLPMRGAMTQHAAAITVAALLGQKTGTGPLPILAQDPAYSPESKRLLAELGIECLGGYGSLAFTHVDDATVVISCHPDIAVRQIVADIARPAVMIWNRCRPVSEDRDWSIQTLGGREVLNSPWWTDQDSPHTRELAEGYERFEFPEPRQRFGDVEICVRKD